MALTIKDFWQLVLQSRLFSQSACEKWAVRCAQELGAERAAQPDPVAEWLVSQKVISRFQAKVLLAGSPGPFVYGDYRVYDRPEKGRLTGLFRAHHVASRHPVLLQFLSGPVVHHPAAWSQFVDWVQVQLDAFDPHLVRWHDLCDLGNFKFLVLEDVRGRSWEEQLAGGKGVAPSTVARVIHDAASGLADLHGRGLVHADVRPANLWSDGQGTTRLLRLANEVPGALTAATPDLLTRADYLAPEFVQPGKVPDALTDIYALGCTAYQLLSGSVPFPGGDVAQKLQRHAVEPIRPLEHQGVPPELLRTVAYMMAKNPAVRFQHLGTVLEQLAPFLGETTPAVIPPPATLAAFEASLAGRAAPTPVTPPTPPPLETSVKASNVAVPETVPGRAPAVTPELSELSVRIVTDVATGARVRKPPKRKLVPVVVSVASAVLVVGAVIVAIMMNAGRPTPASSQAGGLQGPASEVANSGTSSAAVASGAVAPVSNKAAPSTLTGATIVPDDGKLLWASPTAGKEIDFGYLPSGAQFTLFARPSEIESTEEGARVIKALGPGMESVLRQWEETSGLPWGQMETLLLSLHGGDEGLPRPALVVRLREPVATETLLRKWGNPASKTNGKLQNYEVKGWSFLLPPDAGNRVVVMCAPPEMEDILERQGASPPDHRWIGRLRKASDDQRHLTLFCTPQNLRSDLLREGRVWSWGDVGRARACLDWFFGDATQAVMLSLHLGDTCYAELRVAGEIGRDRYTLASDLRKRLAESPELVEAFMVAVNPPPYWRAVAFRFPGMIRFLHDQTRIGVDGEQALLNAVLPLPAAHNLVFGAGMALLSAPGAVAVATTTPNKAVAPKTMDEVLAYRMRVDIPQQDLVNALVDIERTVNEELRGLPNPFKIRMMGNDLKVEGITQNQKITDFKLEDKSLAEILTGLVRKANPDPSVKDASEPGQKLIWVVTPDPDDTTRQIVMVTTRAGAERDGYRLPAPFVAKP